MMWTLCIILLKRVNNLSYNPPLSLFNNNGMITSGNEEGGGPSTSAEGSSTKMADMEIDDDDVDTTAEDDGTSATVANVNKAAKPDIETKEKGDGDDEDDRYDILLREKEDEEEKFIDDVIDAEAAAIPEDELGEVIGSSGNTNEEKSKKMRSVYVEDPNGDLVHKRTLLRNNTLV
mmetsp:Transcript_16240/g.32716  ORF Transcript_16240/g.32716 Transcript_16240/m.32716 type:complete len:176 (-) Transcript_16240:1830-2357(-)